MKFDKNDAQHAANLFQARQDQLNNHRMLTELKEKRESVIQELNQPELDASHLQKVKEDTELLKSLNKDILSEMSKLAALKGNDKKVEELRALQTQVQEQLDVHTYENYQDMISTYQNNLAEIDSKFEKVQTALLQGKNW
jgi:hypothetical protein